MLVYNLEFTREYDDRRDTELSIGVYESREEAEMAVEMLRAKEGFRDYPEGFQIHEWKVGLTGWMDGFVTTYGPPPKDAASEAFDLPALITEKE